MTEECSAQLVVADAAAARGDWAGARAALERAVALVDDRLDLWMRLASIHRATGDPAAAIAAVNRALALQPLDFLALLLRASLLEQQGDAAAGEAYARAIAQRPDTPLAPAVTRMLDHGATVWAEEQGRRRVALTAAMRSVEAVATAPEQARFGRFRSNVLRETEVYHSAPTHYHYPGLVEREFHDREDFPWLAEFEAAAGAIAADLRRVLAAERAELVPYVRYGATEPVGPWTALNHSLDWTAIHLIDRGRVVEANARHCPATMAALARIGQPAIPGRSPNAMFSLLKPGAHIPPHHGIANTRLVCHLALVVPPACWFRVGAETRAWREGEAFVFDDTIEHEAMNGSDAMRAVLIVDLWHPGLSDRERAGVVALMTAGEGEDDGGL